MKTLFIRIFATAAVTLAFAVVSPQLSPLLAQGTAFTYQGQLLTTNGAAHGTYNMTFALYNAGTGGSQVGSTVQTNGVIVTNGLFTITVDFGPGIFTGTAYWLQIGVETNGAASFTALTSRQQLTPTPYAIYSEGGNAAGLTGLIPPASLSGSYPGLIDLNNAANSFSGNGAGLTGVNAAELNGLTAANFWQLTGNAGTTPGPNFVGTTDGKALELNPGGTVGVGTATPNGRLDIEGRAATDVNSIYVLNGYPNGNGIYVTATNGTSAYGIWAFSTGPGVVISSAGAGVSAFSSAQDGVDATANAASAIGVNGAHDAATGTNAGVQGITYSTTAYADGVYGVVESTAPGGYSAGVMGQNNSTSGDGIGVYGTQNGSGWGVYGYAPSGDGVYGDSPDGIGAYGQSDDGYGLYGFSTSGYGAVIGTETGTGIYDYSSGGDAMDAYDYATNSIGILGVHSATGGTNAGVEGVTYSQDPYSAGVYGVVEAGATAPYSAGVLGVNNSGGIGVYGVGPWGVYGHGTGIGVLAESDAGDGLYGSTSTGIGVYAYCGSSGSALTVGAGAIHVSNQGTNSAGFTSAFIQFASSGNITGDSTIINNSLCNGDPNAILIVTPNYSPNGNDTLSNNHPTGVWYTGGKWLIFNTDGAAMPSGAAFNVLIIKD